MHPPEESGQVAELKRAQPTAPVIEASLLILSWQVASGVDSNG